MKKIKISAQAPKRRDPIARALCTQGQFKNKVFENKKRKMTLKRFDWRKDMNGNRFGSRFYLWQQYLATAEKPQSADNMIVGNA